MSSTPPPAQRRRRKKRRARHLLRLFLIALFITILVGGAIWGISSLLGGSPEDSSSSSAPSSASSEASSIPSSSTPVSSEEEESSTPSSPYPLHETKTKDTVTMQFMGDILLHKQPVASAKQEDGTYDFSPYFSLISPYLTADLKIANMEGAVDPSQEPSSYPCFNYPSEIIRDAMGAGINFFTTSNNHSFDKGWKGLVATRESMIEAGVDFCGTYETQEQYDTPCIVNYGGINIGIVPYSYGHNGMIVTIPEENQPFAMRLFNHDSMEDVPRILQDIKDCREAGADFVILSLHWGAEYQDEPTAMQRKIAEALIEDEEGADIVLGNHSHCVQPVELHTVQTSSGPKDRLIVYSMGNFIADQSSVHKSRTRTSQMIEVTIKRQGDEVVLADAAYMPLMTYIREDIKTSDRYRIIPVGKYATAETRPSIFATDADWQFCKDAWERIPSVTGDSIPCLAD